VELCSPEPKATPASRMSVVRRMAVHRSGGCPDREAAADQLLRNAARVRSNHPSACVGRADRHRCHPGHDGGEGQRAGQFIFFGADCAHALDPPCAGGVVAEGTNGFAWRNQAPAS